MIAAVLQAPISVQNRMIDLQVSHTIFASGLTFTIVDPRLRGMYPSEIRPRDKIRAESMKRSNNADNLLREKKFQQERLLATWDRLSIPMFHREAFLKCENLQNLKQTIEILKREQDEIETSCSSIQVSYGFFMGFLYSFIARYQGCDRKRKLS